MRRLVAHLTLLCCGGLAIAAGSEQLADREWLAGDSHMHSRWSPGYDRSVNPPVPLPGQDALYPTPLNAQMARRFGLRWMVTTDHGGPNHSKLNQTEAYRELQQSRTQVPEVLQFYGMELNMPAMDHHTLIVPRTDFEASVLYDLEHRFDAQEAWPADPSRNTPAARVSALSYMSQLPRPPLVFANHPSRSASGLGQFGADQPWEIRQNIDTAPAIYRGMEGAPGHQANGLARDGSPRIDAAGEPTGTRGGYGNRAAPTLGGFDQMTAVVGGLWDSLLGEGRRFWIVATSDSHVHYTEPTRRGNDFWPGEFHKTYVHARPTHDDVLERLRSGQIFVVAGDLINELNVEVSAGAQRAMAGETLRVHPGMPVTLTVRFRDPETLNHRGENPRVARIDVISGQVRGPLSDRHAFTNETTRVIARYGSGAWQQRGNDFQLTMELPDLTSDTYVRVRGTNTNDLEPALDVPGENPWHDLWFYSNPIFISVGPRETAGPGAALLEP